MFINTRIHTFGLGQTLLSLFLFSRHVEAHKMLARPSSLFPIPDLPPSQNVLRLLSF